MIVSLDHSGRGEEIFIMLFINNWIPDSIEILWTSVLVLSIFFPIDSASTFEGLAKSAET